MIRKTAVTIAVALFTFFLPIGSTYANHSSNETPACGIEPSSFNTRAESWKFTLTLFNNTRNDTYNLNIRTDATNDTPDNIVLKNFRPNISGNNATFTIELTLNTGIPGFQSALVNGRQITEDGDDRNRFVGQFTQDGTVWLELRRRDDLGGRDDTRCAVAITKSATVLAANFSADPTSGPAPLTVQFIDQSTGGPTRWDWDFGDDTFITEQNPTHTYAQQGQYSVLLEIQAGGETKQERKNDFIVVTPPTSQQNDTYSCYFNERTQACELFAQNCGSGIPDLCSTAGTRETCNARKALQCIVATTDPSQPTQPVNPLSDLGCIPLDTGSTCRRWQCTNVQTYGARNPLPGVFCCQSNIGANTAIQTASCEWQPTAFGSGGSQGGGTGGSGGGQPGGGGTDSLGGVDIGSLFAPAQSFRTFGELISLLLRNAMVLAGIIVFIVFVAAGIKIIQAAGRAEGERVEQGKAAITAAVVGIVLIIAAFWIVQILEFITGIQILDGTGIL